MNITLHGVRHRCLLLFCSLAAAIMLCVSGCGREIEPPTLPVTPTPPATPAVERDAASQPSAREASNTLVTDSSSDAAAGEAMHDDQPNTLGRTFYFTPSGSGRMDGADWANAAPGNQLQAWLSEKVAAGDQLRLGSGTFPKLLVTASGAPDRPITLTGIDTGEGLPLIKGRWQETNPKYHAHSWNAISLANGVTHVRIGGLQVSGFIYGVKATNNRDVELFDLSITRCREAISLSGLSESTIRDCRMINYAKRGIRFKQGCHDLLIADVVADATGDQDAWPTEAFPFGFAVENGDGNHSIRYERCTARNNVFPGEPGKYWNGDGFLAENNAYNLTYVDCLSLGNSDGGWDDKSRAPQLTGCIAAHNKRGFRLWNVRGDREHPARLVNCLGVYNRSAGGSGSSVGLWLCGAVEAERCTFHHNATAAVGIENNGPGGNLRAVDCIFSSDAPATQKSLVLKEGGTKFEAVGVVQWNAGSADLAPRYQAASPQWTGQPRDAFNSQRYGRDKGFWAE